MGIFVFAVPFLLFAIIGSIVTDIVVKNEQQKESVCDSTHTDSGY